MAKFINNESAIFPWHLHPAQLYALAIDNGISQIDLLNAINLSEADLSSPNLMLSWKQYSAMAQVVKAQGPIDWNIQLGQRLTIASHGLLSLAVMNCKDWAQALDMMIQYKNLVTALFYIEKKETTEHIILELHPAFIREPILELFLQCFFTIVYQAIYQLSSFKAELANSSADFNIYLQADSPSYIESMNEIFHRNLHFSQTGNYMKIHKRYLPIPIAQANPITANNMSALLRGQLLNQPLLKGELHALHDAFRQQQYLQSECAETLNTSTTSLKRKLALAGTSFNKELSLFRQNEACFLLRYSDTSFDEIAAKLGFQDLGSFRRSFKQAYNLLPKDYRKLYFSSL